jgi:hypothetical protein
MLQLDIKNIEMSCENLWKLVVAILATLLLSVTFPLQLIAVKLVSLVNRSNKVAWWSVRWSSKEGLFESSLQFCFQLYIIFSKEDRQPSQIQMLTLIFSLVMIIKTSIEFFLLDQPAIDTYQGVLAFLKLLPISLFSHVFKLGSLTIAFAIFRFNVLYFHAAVQMFLLLGYLLRKKDKISEKQFQNFRSTWSHSFGMKKLTKEIVIFKLAETKSTFYIDMPEDAVERTVDEDLPNIGDVVVEEASEGRVEEKKPPTTANQATNIFNNNCLWLILYSLLLLSCLLFGHFFPQGQELPSIYPFASFSIHYKLSSLPIIKNIAFLNEIVPVLWLCGSLNLILTYYHFKEDVSLGDVYIVVILP